VLVGKPEDGDEETGEPVEDELEDDDEVYVMNVVIVMMDK